MPARNQTTVVTMESIAIVSKETRLGRRHHKSDDRNRCIATIGTTTTMLYARAANEKPDEISNICSNLTLAGPQ